MGKLLSCNGFSTTICADNVYFHCRTDCKYKELLLDIYVHILHFIALILNILSSLLCVRCKLVH